MTMTVEVSAFYETDDAVYLCNDQPEKAQGFSLCICNPNPLEIDTVKPHTARHDGYVSMRETHIAAFRRAGELARHLGCEVTTRLMAGALAYPSRFAIEPQRDFNAADLADTGTAFGKCEENEATQWAVFQYRCTREGAPNGCPDLVEDYPSREAAQAAIDALERGEPLPTPVWPPKRDVLPSGMSFFVAAVSTDDGVEMSDVIWSDVEPNREALLKELSCYPQMSDADPAKVTFYGPFTVGGGAF